MESDAHITGPEATLGEDEYRKVFNGTIANGIDLPLKVKAIKDMTDEEVTSFVYDMEKFIKTARIVAQAARVNLEDRKLRYTEEQKAKLAEFDRAYRPKPVSSPDKPKREKKESGPKLSDYDKKLITLIDVMGMSKDEAEAYLAAKGVVR